MRERFVTVVKNINPRLLLAIFAILIIGIFALIGTAVQQYLKSQNAKKQITTIKPVEKPPLPGVTKPSIEAPVFELEPPVKETIVSKPAPIQKRTQAIIPTSQPKVRMFGVCVKSSASSSASASASASGVTSTSTSTSSSNTNCN